MTDTHLTKMISTRIEPDNITAIDKLSRSQGISRSDWVRRAILAQLVLDLVDLKAAAAEDVPRETPAQVPELTVVPGIGQVVSPAHPSVVTIPDLSVAEAQDRSEVESYIHHPDCIKSYNHEGECLDRS